MLEFLKWEAFILVNVFVLLVLFSGFIHIISVGIAEVLKTWNEKKIEYNRMYAQWLRQEQAIGGHEQVVANVAAVAVGKGFAN